MSEYWYATGFGRRPQANPDFVFKDGLAFPVWLSCGNYSTPHESPYAYGPHIISGPIDKFEGDDIIGDYDDRLRQFYPQRWDGAVAKLDGARLKTAPLANVSAFLSHLYGFAVTCLQVIEGCNVGNGYPYLIFVSRKKAPASCDRSGEADETRSGSTEGESAVPAQPGDAQQPSDSPQSKD
jgi:hypothetical protein